MSVPLANALATALLVYMALGILFAIPFLLRGLRRIDPPTEGSTRGFKLIILPGVIALWPLLAWRWQRGATEPPTERNAHRDAAA